MKRLQFLRNSILIFLSVFLFGKTNAQDWTWVTGDSTYFNLGSFSNYYSSDQTPVPSSRNGSATWTDKQGNLWLYGGFGIDSEGEKGYLSDLWQYVVATNRWKLVGGNTVRNQLSSYGTKGVTAPSNWPSGRYDAFHWVDNHGDFWMFGGVESLEGQGLLGIIKDDMWKYDPLIGQWTFMQGRTAHVTDPPNLYQCYGIKGLELATNDPLPRQGTNNPAWTDLDGNLWLYNETQLWRYNVTNNRWTWMNGGSMFISIFNKNERNFGVKGVPSPINHPGDRNYPSVFIDNAGDFWMYGGHYSGVDPNLLDWGFLNDLWKYSPATNEWTWINGDSVPDQGATYSDFGVASTNFTPGSRGGATAWVDSTGQFWLFGGRFWKKFGMNTIPYYRNDLWKYNPLTNEWTWMKESELVNDQGIYLEQLFSTSDTKPRARYDASKWVNNQGLWLFGGNQAPNKQGAYNDLWCFGCDTLKLKMVFSNFEMPNVFTPNQDGINDVFQPVASEGHVFKNCVIMNRWGNVVFESTAEQLFWDGKSNGEELTDGVYFWKIEVEKFDGEIISETGTVNLLKGNQ